MSEKVLFVDDDDQIRRAYRRRLGEFFQLDTAANGTEGLRYLQTQGPFAVVVSDMRMPGLDGIQFLSRVKEQSPQTVRIMLTGYADMQTAIEAVNEGNIFRFLTKPCDAETLAKAIRAGIEQYRLIIAERELLGKTLRGSIEVLIEILSFVNPIAFGRATRIKRLVHNIARHLQLPNIWQYELAAMLSQIGCVMLPAEVLEKIDVRAPISTAEEQLFATHPTMGRELLERIPRLEIIGQMIEGQQKPPGQHIIPTALHTEADAIRLGAQILNLVLAFDEMSTRGVPTPTIIAALRQKPNRYNPHLVEALASTEGSPEQGRVKALPVSQLKVGMVLAEDVWSTSQQLLVHQGQEITSSIWLRLRNFSRRTGVVEPVSVRDPES